MVQGGEGVIIIEMYHLPTILFLIDYKDEGKKRLERKAIRGQIYEDKVQNECTFIPLVLNEKDSIDTIMDWYDLQCYQKCKYRRYGFYP